MGCGRPTTIEPNLNLYYTCDMNNGTPTIPAELFPVDKTDPTTKSMKENEFPVEHTLEIMKHISVVTKERQTYGWRYWKVPEHARFSTSESLAQAARETYGAKPDAPVRQYKDTWAVWIQESSPEGDPFEDEREAKPTTNEIRREDAPVKAEEAARIDKLAAFYELSDNFPHGGVSFEHLSYLAKELYRVSKFVKEGPARVGDYDVSLSVLFISASDRLHEEAIRRQRAIVDRSR
jgi:hypothetical protein